MKGRICGVDVVTYTNYHGSWLLIKRKPKALEFFLQIELDLLDP
jgi:hypothetical protein